MSTTLNLEEITRIANEAHQRRLDTLRDVVTHHDAVTAAEQQLQVARDDADAALAIAKDAGWSDTELAEFGLTVAPVPKRTSRGRGKQRTSRGRTTTRATTTDVPTRAGIDADVPAASDDVELVVTDDPAYEPHGVQ